jgi:hypothetical protein
MLYIESFCPWKTHNRTLLFCRTLLKHGHHSDYWNQPQNICKCICYLDCHEAGLCCYLVIYIENLLHPLQLFYFLMWPIYRLSLIICHRRKLLDLTDSVCLNNLLNQTSYTCGVEVF